jgi:hypothetical protein
VLHDNHILQQRVSGSRGRRTTCGQFAYGSNGSVQVLRMSVPNASDRLAWRSRYMPISAIAPSGRIRAGAVLPSESSQKAGQQATTRVAGVDAGATA